MAAHVLTGITRALRTVVTRRGRDVRIVEVRRIGHLRVARRLGERRSHSGIDIEVRFEEENRLGPDVCGYLLRDIDIELRQLPLPYDLACDEVVAPVRAAHLV